VLTIDELFSWRSPSAKQYRDQRGELSESDLIDLMIGEPRLIRRPITIRTDDPSRHVLGGKKADIEAIAQA
jgi:arsenate reductase-like glutaredoxin family protein